MYAYAYAYVYVNVYVYVYMYMYMYDINHTSSHRANNLRIKFLVY